MPQPVRVHLWKEPGFVIFVASCYDVKDGTRFPDLVVLMLSKHSCLWVFLCSSPIIVLFSFVFIFGPPLYLFQYVSVCIVLSSQELDLRLQRVWQLPCQEELSLAVASWLLRWYSPGCGWPHVPQGHTADCCCCPPRLPLAFLQISSFLSSPTACPVVLGSPIWRTPSTSVISWLSPQFLAHLPVCLTTADVESVWECPRCEQCPLLFPQSWLLLPQRQLIFSWRFSSIKCTAWE